MEWNKTYQDTSKHMLVKNEIDCYGYIIIHFLHAKNSNMDHYGNFTIVTTY
jgi:hypothetical protein